MNHPRNLTQDKTGEAAPTDDDAVCQERQLLPTERMLEKRANGDDFRCWPSYVYLDWNSFFFVLPLFIGLKITPKMDLSVLHVIQYAEPVNSQMHF